MGAQILVAFGLRRSVLGPGGWLILHEPELDLGVAQPRDLVLAPDIAGWRRERMAEVPDTAASELAPDWICEILSPGTESHDRIRKMECYRRSRVGWAWIVDANARSVEVYENTGLCWAYHSGVIGAEPARLPPFDAIAFDLGEWWAPEPPAEPPATVPDP